MPISAEGNVLEFNSALKQDYYVIFYYYGIKNKSSQDPMSQNLISTGCVRRTYMLYSIAIYH